MKLSLAQIEQLIAISIDAGKEILKVYNTDFDVDYKGDESPLTLADKHSNDVIVKALSTHFPNIPFISEETKAAGYEERSKWEYAWLIDPLDGTKEFVKRNGEFTVNISLLHQGEAIFGIIYVPVTKVIFYAQKGEGTFKIANDQKLKLTANSGKRTDLKVVASRSHLSKDVEQYVDRLRNEYSNIDFVPAGSSLKFCLVAEGKADVYPRLGPTMEWDTAAGQIIAEEAGAKVFRIDNNEPLRYNKENLLNPYFVVTTL